nr:MAG TPA: hypothetical protein [Caudoviricetes sp.]
MFFKVIHFLKREVTHFTDRRFFIWLFQKTIQE